MYALYKMDLISAGCTGIQIYYTYQNIDNFRIAITRVDPLMLAPIIDMAAQRKQWASNLNTLLGELV